MKTNQIVVSILTLLILDILWIMFFMGKKYQEQIPQIQGTQLKTNSTMAIFAYMLMVLGLVIFVLPNIREGYELRDSLMYGFLFGIIVCGVYEFTNATVFEKWNINIAFIGVLWGGFVYFISSYIGSIL